MLRECKLESPATRGKTGDRTSEAHLKVALRCGFELRAEDWHLASVSDTTSQTRALLFGSVLNQLVTNRQVMHRNDGSAQNCVNFIASSWRIVCMNSMHV
jgi:hypothetical protein